MLFLTHHDSLANVSGMAASENILRKFLEQSLSALKINGLIIGKREPSGGDLLARVPCQAAPICGVSGLQGEGSLQNPACRARGSRHYIPVDKENQPCRSSGQGQNSLRLIKPCAIFHRIDGCFLSEPS